MKKRLSALLFISSFSLATTNQLDFNLGRGTPQSEIQTDGSSDRTGSRGTDWSADFLHQTSQGVYAGLGGSQFRSNDRVSQTFVPNSNTTLSSRSSSILFLTRVDIPAQSKMLPYILAGVGWARNSLLVYGAPGQEPLINSSKNALAYATALGIDYALNDRLVIGVEGRYQSALKQTFDLTPTGQAVTGRNSVDSYQSVFILGVKVGVKY